MPAVRFGGEGKWRGECGMKRGGFRERRGHQGGGSVHGRWRRRSVRLPEEEDSQAADRVGPPVSEGDAVG
jgi:hypothetical protein